MNPVQKSYLILHVAIVLFGFSAILGDLIQLSSLVLVWWRVVLASLGLIVLVLVYRYKIQLSTRRWLTYAGIGVLIAIHWITFFGSVKLANASVCLVCMATGAFFTSWLEPIWFRRPISWLEVSLGLFIVPGMLLIANSIHLDMIWGIVSGIVSALLSSIFTILNKQYLEGHPPVMITAIEMSSAALFLTAALLVYLWISPTPAVFWPSGTDWLFLLGLAFGCTVIGYVLILKALEHLSAFISNLTINLEPIYGILLAWFILDDHQELSLGFYWGALIIIGAVFAHPLLRRWQKKRAEGPI